MIGSAGRGRRWLGLALLVPGLLVVPALPAMAQREAKKPQSHPKIQPKPQTKVKPSTPATRPGPAPGASRSASRPAAAAARPPGRAVAAPRPAAEPSACVHVVRHGESLSRIAGRHGVSRAALSAANDLRNPAALRSGQRLAVPGCRRAPEVETAEAPLAAGPRAVASARAAGAAAAEPVAAPADMLVARVGPRRIPTRLHLAIPAFAGGGSVEFVWPVDGPVLSGFGRRRAGWHAGVDIRAERGTEIRAAAPGVVVFSGWETYYGKLVKIEHADGFMTLYAHNLENLVQVGDEVDTDTVIATVGRTGRASGDHLHFEIRRHGMAYNPTHLLEPREPPVLLATPYQAPEIDPVPVSSLTASPDDFEHP